MQEIKEIRQNFSSTYLSNEEFQEKHDLDDREFETIISADYWVDPSDKDWIQYCQRIGIARFENRNAMKGNKKNG